MLVVSNTQRLLGNSLPVFEQVSNNRKEKKSFIFLNTCRWWLFFSIKALLASIT